MSIVIVEAIIFRKKEDSFEFLLLKRTHEEGGFWQSVGGRVEKNESLLDAAFREASEEAGIKKKQVTRVIEDVHFFSFNTHHVTGKPIPEQKEYIFAFEVTPDTEVSITNNPSNEHEEFGWFSLKDALKIMKWPENKNALIKLNDLLIKN
ncbi:MAG: NUDIX hydrolase [Candidatus Nanoarchaeia archaeon]